MSSNFEEDVVSCNQLKLRPIDVTADLLLQKCLTV